MPPYLQNLLSTTLSKPIENWITPRDVRVADSGFDAEEAETDRKHHHGPGDAGGADGAGESAPSDIPTHDVVDAAQETAPSTHLPSHAPPPTQAVRRRDPDRRRRQWLSQEEEEEEPLDTELLVRLADAWLFTDERPDLQPWVQRAEAALADLDARTGDGPCSRLSALEHYLSVARAQRHALQHEAAPPPFPHGADVDDILRISGWRRHVLEDELTERPDLFRGTALEHPLDATGAGLRRLLEDGPAERTGQRARERQQMDAALGCMRQHAQVLMQAGLRDALQRALRDMAAMTAFLHDARVHDSTD